jgi:hypothetical protein
MRKINIGFRVILCSFFIQCMCCIRTNTHLNCVAVVLLISCMFQNFRVELRPGAIGKDAEYVHCDIRKRMCNYCLSVKDIQSSYLS